MNNVKIVNNIEDLYMSIFNKYGSNKLLSSLIYSYSLLDAADIRLLYIPFVINKSTNNEFNNTISLSIIFSILSLNILYDLPHMLDNSHRNNKLSLDNIFGETIAQLASFCLFIESSNVILESNLDNTQKNIIINMMMRDTGESDYLVNNLHLLENNSSSLEVDYMSKFKKIIRNNIISVITYIGIEFEINIIHHLVDIIISQYLVFKKYKNHLIEVSYKLNKLKIIQLIGEGKNLEFMYKILDLFH